MVQNDCEESLDDLIAVFPGILGHRMILTELNVASCVNVLGLS